MKFSEQYKGAFFKAADVALKPKRLTIGEIVEEEVSDEKKVVVRFEEAEQGLVLNKTNASVLAEKWGDEMEDWIGKQVILRADKTQFNGKLVPCVRVEAAPQRVAKPAPVVEEDDLNV